MQIQVSNANIKLCNKYVAKMRKKFPAYNPSTTLLINSAAELWLINELEKKKNGS